MRTNLSRLLNILEKIERPLTIFGSFLLFIMMVHVVADVFSKYMFNQPITGTIEIVSNFYMVGIVFLPLAMVELQNGHVKVEVFTTAMPPRYVAAFDVFASLLTLVYVAILSWFLTMEAIKSTEIRETIQVGVDLLPMWQARWFAPAGTSGFLLVILFNLLRNIDKLRGGNGGDIGDKKEMIDEWTV